jgi:hypothetical protein
MLITLAAPIACYRSPCATTLQWCAQEQKPRRNARSGKVGIATEGQMFGCLRNVQLTLDFPAPVVVGGVLFVAALTKGGHPGWGVGGVLALYVLCALYVAIRNSTRRADIRRQALGASAL